MSSTFIRGPICGVDNCPSRLWRIIAGRRTCQYGHVMEGDIEFNNDDDAAGQQSQGVITRRLNLTTNQQGSFQSSFSLSQQNIQKIKYSKKFIKGKQAKLLMIKSLQYILKKQVDYLINICGFPVNFENIVKLIWLSFLSKVNNEPKGVIISLNINITVSVIYFSILQLGLPVYFCDLIGWISSLDFPYYKAGNIIPRSWNERLPNFYLSSLNGNNLLTLKTFTDAILRFNSLTHTTKKFNGTINVTGLIFKLVTLNTLPPEFFFYTQKFVELFCSDEKDLTISIYKIPNRSVSNHLLLPETYVILSFILTIRYILLYDGVYTEKQIYPNSWLEALLRTAPINEEDISEKSVNRRLTKLLNTNHDVANEVSSNPINWTEKETINYLTWIERKFVPLEVKNHEELGKFSMDEGIILRKLNDIVPLDSTDFPYAELNRTPLTFIEELQEKYLRLLDSVDNNNSNTVNSNRVNEDIDFKKRLDLICKLENKITFDLSNDFNTSVENLQYQLAAFETRIKTYNN